MAALIFLLLNLGASFFKPKIRLDAENAALRQQLIVLQRKVRGRVEFTNSDRLFFIQLYRWFPSILKAITTFRPETLVRWHRAGFRRYWRWKSRNLGGRPQIAVDLQAFMVSCSSSALRSRSRPSPSTWPGRLTRPVSVGAPSCETIRRTSQLWICSWFRASASICSTFWS